MATYSELADRVVIVTGGAAGIGEACVRAFAAQGCRVGLIDVDGRRGVALQETLGPGVRFQACDVTDISALRAAIDAVRTALGPVHALINNAGHDERHDTLKVTEAYWDDRIAVNLKHQFFAAQAVLPDMIARGGGSIINLGSCSWIIGQGGMAAYTASKSAVLGLTRSLARDFGRHGVRVNAISPGWIMTERQLEMWVTPETERSIFDNQCLKRRLNPEDVARLAVFLVSDEASAITNQNHVIDGGWT